MSHAKEQSVPNTFIQSYFPNNEKQRLAGGAESSFSPEEAEKIKSPQDEEAKEKEEGAQG